MAKLTVTQLEKKVQELNDLMLTNGLLHKDYKKWESSRNYYVGKLTEMDEHDLKTIEI